MAKDMVGLEIPDDLVKTLNQIDRNIGLIGNRLPKVTQQFRDAFGIANGVTTIQLLTKMGEALEAIKTNTQGLNGVGAAVGNIGSEARDAARGAVQMADAMGQAVQNVQKLGAVDLGDKLIAPLKRELDVLNPLLNGKTTTDIETARSIIKRLGLDIDQVLSVHEPDKGQKYARLKNLALEQQEILVKERNLLKDRYDLQNENETARTELAKKQAQKRLADMMAAEREKQRVNAAESEALDRLMAKQQAYNELIAKAQKSGGFATQLSALKSSSANLENIVTGGVQDGNIDKYKADVKHAEAAVQLHINALKQDMAMSAERAKQSQANAEQIARAHAAEDKALAEYGNRIVKTEELMRKANNANESGSNANLTKAISELDAAQKRFEDAVTRGVQGGNIRAYTDMWTNARKELDTYEKRLREVLTTEKDLQKNAPPQSASSIISTYQTNKPTLVGDLKKEIEDITKLLNQPGTMMEQGISEQLKNIRYEYEQLLKTAQQSEVERNKIAQQAAEKEGKAAEDAAKKATKAAEGKLAKTQEYAEREAQAVASASTKQINATQKATAKSKAALDEQIQAAQKAAQALQNVIDTKGGDMSKRKVEQLNRSLQELQQRITNLQGAAGKINPGTLDLTSYAGAMANSKNLFANGGTMNQWLQGLDALKTAKGNVKVGSDQWREITAEITKYEKKLEALGVKTRELAGHQSHLFNISGQLGRQLSLMFSVSQIEGYISKMAKVRGEMELQQRSLQAILQNKTKADEVFNKTVQSALKSPFRIQQLVTYTKQLAAYRVESDKLFDTTKRLADVSAGLGVDMQRLILAYGQVKAAAYLRGTEVRQFTEAGINLYGELQKYFEEVKGEAHTTAEIVDMISKRKVTFEDIEQVFKRLTDQGGLFYNMQEIQSETLQGKIGKLQDAIDMMYNSIGKANEGLLKGMVDLMITLTRNWETIANVAKELVATLAMVKLQSVLSSEKTIFAAIDAGILKTEARALKATEGIRLGLGAVGKSLMTLGSTVKTFVATNWVLLAVVAAIGAAYKVFSHYSDLKEAFHKIDKETNAHISSVNRLTNEYANLEAKLKSVAEQHGKLFDPKEVVKGHRNMLKQLIGQFKEYDLTVINIDPENIDEDKLDEAFYKVYKKYVEFQRQIAFAKKLYEGEDATWLTEGIRTDTKDVEKDYNDAMEYVSSYKDLLEQLQPQFDKLTDDQKKFWKEASETYDKNHALDNYEELKKFMESSDKLVGTIRRTNNANKLALNNGWENRAVILAPDWGVGLNNTQLRMSVNNLYEHIRNIKADFQRRHPKATEIEIKTFLNTLRATEGWNDFVTKMYEKEFEVNLKLNKDNIEPQVATIDEIIRDYFKDKGYDINLNLKTVADDLTKKQKETAEAIEKLMAEYKMLTGRDWEGETNVPSDAKKKAKEKNCVTVAPEIGSDKGAWERSVDEYKVYLDKLGIAEDRFYTKSEEKAGEAKNNVPNALIDGIDVTLGYYNKASKQFVKLTNEELAAIDDMKLQEAMVEQRAEGYSYQKDTGGHKKDPYQEQLEAQIKLIEDMVAKYNELRKVQGQDLAVENTVEAFREQIKDVNLSDTIVGLFKPTDDGEIKAVAADLVDKIRRGFTDNDFNFIRGMDLTKYLKEFRAAGEKVGKWNAEVEVACDKDSLEAAKKEVEAAFAGKELFEKFKEMGLPLSEIRQLPFFKDMKTSWAEVYAEINRKYNPMNLGRDELKKNVGEDVFKAWEEAMKKAREGETKERSKQMEDIVKAYRTQLSDQLQLDRWYREERAKIDEQFKLGNISKEQKEDYTRNLETQYQKKTNKNVFDQFKSSETYVAIFQQLDQASIPTLRRLEERLKAVGKSMKDLDPTQMREMANILKKLNEAQINADPFGSLGKLNQKVKELKEQGITEEGENRKIIENDEKLVYLEEQSRITQEIYEYKSGEREQDERMQELARLYPDIYAQGSNALRERLKLIERLKAEAAGENAKAAQNLSTFKDQRKAQMSVATAIEKVAQQEGKAYKAATGLMKVLGVDEDDLIFADMAQDLVQMTLNALMFQLQLEATTLTSNAMGVSLKSAMGIIGWIAMALEAVVAIFTAIFSAHDKGLQRQIESLQNQVERLKESLEDLSKAFDNAWSLSELKRAKEEMESARRAEIEAWRRMIALEKEKKDSDKDKIKEWKKNIKDAYEAIADDHEKFLQKIGGFGAADFKSGAQDFIDAWVDAFNEGGDTLDALEDKFDEVIANMVKKQSMLRVAQHFLNPIMDEVNKSLEDDSRLSGQELASISEKANNLLPQMNEELYKLMDALGYTGKNSGLSALAQSIQNITEPTAEALEGLVSSVRFYQIQVCNDVSIIRRLLEEHYGQASPSAPMLTELRAQTNYLQRMCGHFDAAFTYGPSSGKGLRVYMA